MARRIATGIDIGTHQVKVVIAEAVAERGRAPKPHILGTGLAESKGLRHGYIVNTADVMRSVAEARKQAEHTAGMKIKKAYLAIGGIGIEEYRSTGEAIVSRADSEISDLDVRNAVDAARELSAPAFANRRILQEIPLAFRVDGQMIPTDRPQGLKGTKLEVDMLFVTTLRQHSDDLIAAVEELGIEIEDEMASPLAGSFVTLTKSQKKLGCVLADIGSETVSIVVYDHSLPISVKVFDIGSNDITNDLALALRIPPEDAEKLKLGRLAGDSYPQNKVNTIIGTRLKNIFALIDAHLESIGKRRTLPAGVIISGGGAGIGAVKDIAKQSLKLPSQLAHLNTPENSKVKDSSWAVAYGLTIWGLSSERDSISTLRVRTLQHSLISFLKKFLP